MALLDALIVREKTASFTPAIASSSKLHRAEASNEPRRRAQFRLRLSRTVVFLLVGVCLSAIPTAAGARRVVFRFDPATTEVGFTLGATLHTVHGTMKLKSGEIRYDPETGTASGTVVVDATTAETGNKSRDHKMHKEVLQSARYPEIVFTAQHANGVLQPTGTSQLQLSGQFEIEGRQHPMTLEVAIVPAADAGRGTASTKFQVPYSQWGLKNPSTLFLRVSDHVDLEIHAVGFLETVN